MNFLCYKIILRFFFTSNKDQRLQIIRTWNSNSSFLRCSCLTVYHPRKGIWNNSNKGLHLHKHYFRIESGRPIACWCSVKKRFNFEMTPYCGVAHLEKNQQSLAHLRIHFKKTYFWNVITYVFVILLYT